MNKPTLFGISALKAAAEQEIATALMKFTQGVHSQGIHPVDMNIDLKIQKQVGGDEIYQVKLSVLI